MLKVRFPPAVIALAAIFMLLQFADFARCGGGAGADPVKNLQDALQRIAAKKGFLVKPTPADVRNEIDALRSLSDLIRAANLRTLEANTAVYNEVLKMLNDRIKSASESTKSDIRKAAAVIMGDLADTATANGLKKNAHRHFWVFLHKLADDQNADVRQSALRSMGKIPPLIRSENPLRMTLAPILLQKLKSGTAEDRRAAAGAIADWLDRATDASSKGKFLMTDKTRIVLFRRSLEAIRLGLDQPGQAKKDLVTRRESLKALEQLGWYLERPVPKELLKLLPKKTNFFAKVKTKINEVILSPSFASILSGDNVELRLLCLRALENIASARANMVTQTSRLKEALAPPADRISTRQSIGKKGKSSTLLDSLSRAALKVAPMLHDRNIRIRLTAIDFLEVLPYEEFTDAQRGTVQIVVEALTKRIRQDRDVFVRWSASRTLGRIGRNRLGQDKTVDPATKSILRNVTAALARSANPRYEHDVDVRQTAAKALEQLAIGSKSGKQDSAKQEQLIGIIIANSKDNLLVAVTEVVLDPPVPAWVRSRPVVFRDMEPRIAALAAFRVMAGGPVGSNWRIVASTAKGITPKLIPLLRSPQPKIRIAVAETLGSFPPQSISKEASAALKQALNDPDADVRIAAGSALMRLKKRK